MAGYDTIRQAGEDRSFARKQKDIFEGWSYSTGAIFTGVPSGETRNIWIENPSDSGNFIIVTSRFSTSGEFLVQKIDSVTKDSDGTSLTTHNRKISNGSASVNTQKEIGFSGGNEWTKKVVGSGSNSGASIAGANVPDGEIILEEGDNVLFKAENNTSSSLDVNIDVDFFETPLSEVSELG